MKKNVYTFIFIATILNCTAQDNFLPYEDLTINNITIRGENSAFIIANFGSPNTIEDYFFEMEDVEGKKYTYDGILIYFIADKAISFEINNNFYSFTPNNINIGDAISTLESVYP